MNRTHRSLWTLYSLQVLLGAWAAKSVIALLVGFCISIVGIIHPLESVGTTTRESSKHSFGRLIKIIGSLGDSWNLRLTGSDRVNVWWTFLIGAMALGSGLLYFLWVLRFSDPEKGWIHRIFGALIPVLLLYQGSLIWLLTKRCRWLARETRWISEWALLPLSLMTVVMAIAVTPHHGGEINFVAISVGSVAVIAAFHDAIKREIRLSINASKLGASAEHPQVVVTTEKPFESSRPYGLLLMVYGLLAWTGSYYVERGLPFLQLWMDSTIVNSTESLNESALGLNYRYVNAATLTSVADQILESPQQIAFRAYCQVQPGYLRGRVFENYRDGRWSPTPVGTAASGSRDLLPTLKEPTLTRERDSLNHFQLAPATRGRQVTIEIQNDPTRGNFFFTPLGTEAIEGHGARLQLDRNDIPRSGILAQHPYRAIIGEAHEKSGREYSEQGNYLTIPTSLADPIRDLAQELCAGSLTEPEKVEAIESFFQTQFQYSMERTPSPPTEDPILYFLKKKHPAHCEYFATAAALLLRSVKIPTRYVTGYVTSELSDNEEYWLARNRNAHAWVEAYLAQDSRWVVVESTPGRNIVEIDFSNGAGSKDSEVAYMQGKRDESSILSRLERWLTNWSQRTTYRVVVNVFLMLLLGGIVWVLLLRYYPAIPPWLTRGIALEPHELELRSLDRMAAKCGHFRNTHETLDQFAQRLERELEANPRPRRLDLKQVAKGYRNYSFRRYAGETQIKD